MNAAIVLYDACAQWLEVEGFQRAPRVNLVGIMSDQQPAVDQMDVCFDVAEAVLESIEQRTLMLVIVMSVSLRQRICRAAEQGREAKQNG
jgi:hypothetical protein